MVLIEVTVTRARGSALTAINDAERLDVVLNEANQYRATFDGVMFHIDGQYALVIKSSKKIVRAKLSEIIIKTIPATV